MRRVLMYAIPIVLAVGLLAAVANSPEDGKDLAAPDLEQSGEVTDTTIPAVIESPPVTVPVTAPPAPPVVETTTTTMAPPPPPPPAPTPTTMARPRPAASPRPRPTPPTTAAPAPPPTATQPETIDCGTGSASARARLVNEAGTYRLVATVINESTKAIQLDSLLVQAVYAGTSKTFTVNVGGRVIEPRPGPAEMTFDIPESAGAGAPSNFEISEFRFHTAGLPQCASQ